MGIYSAKDKLKLLPKSALNVLLVGFSLYIPLTCFCPTEEKIANLLLSASTCIFKIGTLFCSLKKWNRNIGLRISYIELLVKG